MYHELRQRMFPNKYVTKMMMYFFPDSYSVYSSAIQEVSNSLLYNGLIEELVDVLHLQDSVLVVSRLHNCVSKLFLFCLFYTCVSNI